MASARRSTFEARPSGRRVAAETASRWTTSRASGSAMARISQVRNRLESNAHMVSHPSAADQPKVPSNLAQRSDELAQQSDNLAQQSDNLAQQSDELAQQSD